MADPQFPGFAKLVPGFDFLQNLAKGAAQSLPQVPGLSNWVAPTLNVEELDKRIQELKAVQFWLEQNSRALAATVQALEVQKMTLATLKGMNMQMGELAGALKLQPGAAEAPEADAPSGATKPRGGKAGKAADAGAAAAGVVDPLQWWGSLTQQFQQIAADAFKDAARTTAVDTARNMAAGVAKEAMKTASGMVRAATPGGARKSAAKAPARKAAPRRAGKAR